MWVRAHIMVNLCELMPATSVNMGTKMFSKAGSIVANTYNVTYGTCNGRKNNFATELIFVCEFRISWHLFFTHKINILRGNVAVIVFDDFEITLSFFLLLET